MIEKRGYPRNRVFKYARIDCARDGYWSCQVKDLSQKGVRLRLAAAHLLPTEINIEIASMQLLCSAQVRWQIGREAGFEFTGRRRFKDCVPPVDPPEGW
ncbi:MAG TPA: PilZ domain-containing protein [Aestuariivirgaceae bacterium]|nr:PilZ domain-containing protein [Aestuariivirgaceae bacterium]